MWVRPLSVTLAGVTLVLLLAGCAGAQRESEPKHSGKPAAPSSERVAFEEASSSRTFVLATGWMPSGHGFAITARRYAWRGRSHVVLSASIVGRAHARAAIERQAATGSYGSTQSNVGTAATRFLPGGLVDCSAHPAVLLFAWAASEVRAALREHGTVHPLPRATAPAALNLPAGELLYVPQTAAAAIIQPNAATETLPPPPQRRTCRHGTESITYAFGPEALSSSGTG
jgi:hypothetical protein